MSILLLLLYILDTRSQTSEVFCGFFILFVFHSESSNKFCKLIVKQSDMKKKIHGQSVYLFPVW